jgi:peptide/nickel transport system substrate-binding protein
MKILYRLLHQRVIFLSLLGLFFLNLLPKALAEGPKMGGTLKFIAHANLKVLDPIWTTAYITRNHGYMIYDTLFALDKDFKVQPQMIDTWQVSSDNLQYTFTLREGLKFHDGNPVTSEDVIASLKRWGQRDSLGKMLMKATAKWETIDARTFRLELKEPFGLVLEALGKPSSNVPFIMPARIAASSADEQIKEVVGSGPFKFVKEEWEPGHKVVYVRNLDYVPRSEPPSFGAGSKKVYIDRVEWLYIPDPATASAALNAGEVDYWERLPVDLVPLLEKNPKIQIFIDASRVVQFWLRPNHLHPPFNDPKARQALVWMADQEIYMQAIIGDTRLWLTCSAYFMCGTPWETFTGSDPQMGKNLEKARQLLQEAGYDGRSVVVMDPTDQSDIHTSTLVTQQLLTQIGIKVDLQAMDWSTLVSRRAEKKPPEQGGWNLFGTWWQLSDVFNPVGNPGVVGDCEKAWFGWYCSKKMEDLRTEWARTQDPEKRKQLAEEIQKLAYEEVPYVPLGQATMPDAYHKHVKGVVPFTSPVFWNVWLNK